MELQQKLNALKDNIRAMGKLAIAFSGGVDSTLLLKVASDVLGENAMAITAQSSIFPAWEQQEAAAFSKELGVRHVYLAVDEMAVEGFAANPKDRCYHCKKAIFSRIFDTARAAGIPHVADGTNADDTGDYRPGMRAIQELGAVSPLLEAGMTKQDIRDLSAQMGLPTWNKPSYACLASRVPYGEQITKEKLAMIEKGEAALLNRGFRQVRVRHHGNLARIEVGAEERSRLFDTALLDELDREFKAIGYAYATLDLRGYRTGAMNEVLTKENS